MANAVDEKDHLFEAWVAACTVSQLERAELGVFLTNVALEYKKHDLYGMGKTLTELAMWLNNLPAEPTDIASLHDLKVAVFGPDGKPLEIAGVYTRFGFGEIPPYVQVILAGESEATNARQ